MPNESAHRLGAAAVIGSLTLVAVGNQQEPIAKPDVASGLAYLSGTLPDIMEPALHPNHRKFFHSLGFASVMVYGLYTAGVTGSIPVPHTIKFNNLNPFTEPNFSST